MGTHKGSKDFMFASFKNINYTHVYKHNMLTVLRSLMFLYCKSGLFRVTVFALMNHGHIERFRSLLFISIMVSLVEVRSGHLEEVTTRLLI